MFVTQFLSPTAFTWGGTGINFCSRTPVSSSGGDGIDLMRLEKMSGGYDMKGKAAAAASHSLFNSTTYASPPSVPPFLVRVALL